jgi:hypothetical protein
MTGEVLPGAVRQIGYVVRDLEDAIDEWLALGVGPWLTLLDQHLVGCVHRGNPSEPTISMAFANSGDLQVELIQQLDGTPSIYTEFTDAGREGFHQLAWWAEDYDNVASKAHAAGWDEVWSGDGNGAARFAYFEGAALPATVVEVMELNDSTRWLADSVRTAADEWDGRDRPVRPLF